MATAAGDVFKEFHALARNINKLSDGQAEVMLDDEDQDESTIAFLLLVSPNDGHYKGATIKFRVRVTSEYPIEAPEVTCLNSVYHPNIDLLNEGQPSSICVNLIGEDWEPEVGLDGCVIAVLFLFHHPNQDDALSSAFSGTSMDEEEFAANVKTSLRGEDVDEYSFDKLVNEDNMKDEQGDNILKANEEAMKAEFHQSEVKEMDEPVENMPNTTMVMASTDADVEDDASVATKTDTILATEADILLKVDAINISKEPENNNKEEKNATEIVTSRIMKLDLPIIISEYLLKETRPLEVFSYNWRNVTFSFCHMLKWLFRQMKKRQKNERTIRAIDCS